MNMLLKWYLYFFVNKKCYPPPDLIFNAFKLTDLKDLKVNILKDIYKVVIVGQDPYHQPGQAMGLCFSVPRCIQTPPSLKNIYKGIINDKKITNFKVIYYNLIIILGTKSWRFDKLG